jgi:chorismate mutase-like protein
MPSSPESLDVLRARIDEIDDRLHALLMERTAVVGQVAAAKEATPGISSLRPGREAAILRRLMAAHRGPLGRGTVVRIWRELITSQLMIQTQFAVAVYVPQGEASFWDLARDHFSSNAPMTPYRSIGQVLSAVTESASTVGVVPMPQQGDTDPWWRGLLSRDEMAPRVFARLPFGPRGNARTEGGDALAIGRVPVEPTGADRSLLIVESGGGTSRGRLISSLGAAGLPCTFVAAPESRPEASLFLVEVEGFVTPEDDRLRSFLDQVGETVGLVQPIGAYAIPLGDTDA